MRVLVTGWFGTEDGEITAGDLLAAATVRGWLQDAGVAHDVALADGFRSEDAAATGGRELAPAAVDPAAYTHVLFVCGPVASDRVAALLAPFGHCTRIALGTSHPAGAAARFDAVLARDGDGPPRPDLSLGAPRADVPVVAAVLAHAQPEYGERGRHAAANALLAGVVHEAGAAPLPVDTRLDPHDALGSRTPAQLEAILARADAVVTTRLHGLVLALRAGVPAVALDPIAGGAKVTAQAEALGWPATRIIGETDADVLGELLRWCLSEDARARARAVAAGAQASLAALRDDLLALLQPGLAAPRDGR